LFVILQATHVSSKHFDALLKQTLTKRSWHYTRFCMYRRSCTGVRLGFY